MPSTKLVLIDGNAIMHRAYHALPSSMTTKKGKPINAVYGLVLMLLKVITDLSPTHIAFAFDRPEPTFRKKILVDYQGHRPEMDSDLSVQFKIAQDVIKSFGIPVYDKAGYEADDVIGTIASQVVKTDYGGLKSDDEVGKKNIEDRSSDIKFQTSSRASNLKRQSSVDEVVIVTGDRDMLQLVSDRDRVRLYMPVKGLSEAKLFGQEQTIERMGVPSSQIVDFKALVGDPSDNYKGVPGIGPKTAVKLLEEYGTLENIYKNLAKLPEKTRTLLQKNKDSAYVSQKLAVIVRDVSVNIDLKEMGKWELNKKQVFEVFDKIGFKTLGKRVKKLGEEIAKEKQMTLV
ncbi:hypothetical protein A2125_02450 [Candidatus Woesebacteria bacterium GWB1_43_5]|uniref:5'-3' exonuclease domain-containing protein n=1 Tax=Candidatus Woesebacteria bacterium GWB1_43_5 TaxID=1802474 RepID=A0A1F7WTA0_9BACT|nr:MAG: hypothetical protein A2125_02450 [Candidatus Woesebacteria bacterium GWB1_43_5]